MASQGTEIGSLYYDLNIDDKNLNKQLDGADSKVKSFGDRVNQTWGKAVDSSKQFALAIGGLTVAAVGFGVASVKAFEESENLIAQTNAVLKSTGGIAGMTAESIDKLSKSLQRTTTFSDEEVRSAENLLLTFTSIGKDIFPQATSTVLDMATALGEDTKSASIQLGKALQDPILGITALRRVGVNFSDAQKTVIENLVNTGQKAKAQQLILKELNTEFGGSAAAQIETFAGAMKQLGNIINDVQELIGGLIVKALDPLIGAVSVWIANAGGAEGIMVKLTEAFHRFQPYIPVVAGAIISILLPAFISLAGAALAMVGTWALLAAPGIAVVLIAQRMGIGLDDVKAALDRLKPALTTAHVVLIMIWETLKGIDLTIQGTEPKYAAWQNAIISIKNAIVDWYTALWNVYKVIGGFLINVFQVFQGVLDLLMPSIRAYADALMNDWVPAMQHAWESIVRLWNALNPALVDALKIIALIIGAVLIAALWVFINVLNIVAQAIAGVINFVAMLIGWFANLVAWLGNAITWVARLVGAFWSIPGVMQAVANAIVGPWRGAFNAIASYWNGTVGKLSWTVPKWVPNLGGNTIGAPKIPMLAEGGIVTQPTIAMLGEAGREAIMPLAKLDRYNTLFDRIEELATSNGGTTTKHNDVNINGDINVYDKSDADYLLRRLDRNQQLENLGSSPI